MPGHQELTALYERGIYIRDEAKEETLPAIYASWVNDLAEQSQALGLDVNEWAVVFPRAEGASLSTTEDIRDELWRRLEWLEAQIAAAGEE